MFITNVINIINVIKMERVRDGVTIKVRRSTHHKLNRIIGDCLAKFGERVTYSDVIEALIDSSTDPLEAIKKKMRR